ncbi:MAG: SAM-dependent chlorinase/fluorinase [Flavobacteriaceae bacterium]|nr:SAM-dependent chlorinase/fluorinase [Flavobacteriaceae bacterium]
MPIITLTTDFGTKDPSVGAVKGAIYSELKEATVVDISHQIDAFNIAQTAYVINNSYKSFPEGTIHIIGVDSELNKENKHIALLLDHHYFICPDNGIIAMLASKIKPEKIVEINIHDAFSTSFPVLDIFVKAACHIARGGTLEVIGKSIVSFKNAVELSPIVNKEKTEIKANIIYIDNYGNLITNITQTLMNEIGRERPFEISARGYTFTKIFSKYSDIVNFDIPKAQRQNDGKKLAIYNSCGHLELAIYRSNLKTVGGAADLFGLKYRDRVSIKFY